MKPQEKKPEIIYRIIDKKTKESVGSYSRAYCNEYDFNSVDEARSANCHDIFKDKGKYRIAKYKVTYTLIDDDCDNAKDVKEDTRSIQQIFIDDLIKQSKQNGTI